MKQQLRKKIFLIETKSKTSKPRFPRNYFLLLEKSKNLEGSLFYVDRSILEIAINFHHLLDNSVPF